MDVTMPQLGETVTEGTITRWLKQPGDPVKADEPLFEVSTDKVDSEVPAPASGVLAEIRVSEGETAPVGQVLAVISDAPAGAPVPPAAAPAPVPPPSAPAPVAPAVPVPASTPAATPIPPVETPAPPASAPPEPAPAARAPEPAPAEPAPPAPSPVGADETEPGVVVKPTTAPRPPVSSAAAPVATSAALTSPVVRRLVAEHGLDAGSITGTGEGGRITRKDVLDAAARSRDETLPGAAPAPAKAPAPAVPSQALPPSVAPAAPAPEPPTTRTPGGDLVVPFSNMRRRTAEHMVRSKATSPHASTAVEVDFERIERVRAAHQDEWKAREGFTLTYLPFVARTFCDTVDDFPNVNASVVEETLVVHRDVHLAIAVDLDFGGLIAPVVRDADGKRLRLIAREIREIALRARAKQLTPDEVLGGTFTITNPGPYGTFLTVPIINQPQVAILATDGITKRPRVVQGPDGQDVIAVRHVGMLGITWDHRAFDGAYAASFLSAMREHLEHHDWASELE